MPQRASLAAAFSAASSARPSEFSRASGVPGSVPSANLTVLERFDILVLEAAASFAGAAAPASLPAAASRPIIAPMAGAFSAMASRGLFCRCTAGAKNKVDRLT